MKSGTRAGLSTGGGILSAVKGYTPGIGGSEDGDGNGTKGNELCVFERGKDELPLPEENDLVGPEVGTEGGYLRWENDGEGNENDGPGDDVKFDE